MLLVFLLFGKTGYAQQQSSEVPAQGESSAMTCNKDNRFDQRVCQERRLQDTPFALIPHKPSYILVSRTDSLAEDNSIYENEEIKFQLSFKVPIYPLEPESWWRFYFGYTQLSLWQLFNRDQSSPFRETNYEPEVMLYFLPNLGAEGWALRLINLGLWKHQSNGQSLPKSRSWDRHYVQFVLGNDRTYIDLLLWARVKENPKTSALDTQGDDNPDIEKYLGHGELRLMHARDSFNLSLLARHTRDKRGALQLDVSMPIGGSKKFRWYFQLFDGYGESLIDYNVRRKRAGVGFMLADWL